MTKVLLRGALFFLGGKKMICDTTYRIELKRDDEQQLHLHDLLNFVVV